MKTLIIRFSSFGDILQALPSAQALKLSNPNNQVDWIVREDFAELLKHQSTIQNVVALKRKTGFLGLLKLIWALREHNYTHVYDAHNNVRSLVVRLFLRFFLLISLKAQPRIVVRSKNRWKRILFFKLNRRSVFKMPFRGSHSFLEPLVKWGISLPDMSSPAFQIPELPLPALPDSFIALVPSAAWPSKRWPLPYWKELIAKMPEKHFVVLGGPQDHFCQELADQAPDRVMNLAGKTSLLESCHVLQKARLTISADTGLLHAADQLHRANIALIGPTAFGYPSFPRSQVLETTLSCKPCSKDGRDRCKNSVYQKCMLELTPELVAQTAKVMLSQ